MKKILFTALCALTVETAEADTLLNTAFATTEGNIVMSSDGLVITFANGKLTATNSEETRTFSLSDVTKFYFTSDATGIKDIDADGDRSVDVYTLSGQHVGRFPASTRLADVLGKGVYVVKGTRTQKTIVR